MTIWLVSFADTSMSHVLRRLERQSSKIALIEGFRGFTERSLDPEFSGEFHDVLNPDTKGFGYWLWKPQIILQVFREIQNGDVVIYVDGGCHINPKGQDRLLEYVQAVMSSTSGILGFELKVGDWNTHPEEQWTKQDVFDYFGADEPHIRQSAQICAGIFLIQKRSSTENFLRDWINTFRCRRDLFTDQKSLNKNSELFRAHRHDQSIFSVMSKRKGIELFSHYENFPSVLNKYGDPDWNSLKKMPLLAKRDKYSLRQKIKSKMKSFIQRISFRPFAND